MIRRTSPHDTGDRRDERGIAVLFFAISITAMLAVGALVLGGSLGYTAVRNAQTAADSAALAGATALHEHKHNWSETSAQDLLDEVRTVVERNGGTLAADGCHLVTAEYGLHNDESHVLARCEEISGLDDAVFQEVAGVRVTVSDRRDVPFAAFVSQETITGTAVAAATIQPVVQTSMSSVFMVCAAAQATGHPERALVPDAGDRSGYAVNEAAIGKTYVLWGNEIKTEGTGRDCGNPSSDWRGLIKFDTSFPVPSPSLIDDAQWWQAEHGNKTGNIDMKPSLAGKDACRLDDSDIDDLAIGCRIAVPLCPMSNETHAGLVRKSGDFRLYCAKIGAFEISHIGDVAHESDAAGEDDDTPCGARKNNIICGRFVGAATAVSGKGSARAPGTHDFVVVKLVE